MGNRKPPFGYKIELGTVVIQSSEAEVVQWIYERYSQGDSYTVLVQQLKEQPVSYMPGKLWNKNMVARILEDGRYICTQDYPVIIDKAIAMCVTKKRREKQNPKASKTDAQKILRKLSGDKATEQMEQRVLELLNGLIARPERIEVQTYQMSNVRIRELTEELDKLLAQMPVDEERGKCLVMELATEQYASIGDSRYETERLKQLLGKKKPMKTLDVELLKNTVAKINIRDDGAIWMQLQNGQGIE